MAFAAALGAIALRDGDSGRPTRVDAASLVPDGQGDETATADVPGDMADLVIGWWRYDFDFEYCIRPGQGRILVVLIENVGRADAGGFSVRAANVEWRVDGLAAGEARRLTSPLYPVWPLVVDADDEVAESDETNNSAGPSAAATWTPTIVSTEPPECTATPEESTPAVTPTTATPSGPLPDLVVLSLGWGPERPVPTCALYSVPWFGFVTIANQGRASAGPFSVRAPRVSWAVDGLAAGATRVLVSLPGRYPDVPIVADPDNAVAESDETNNVYDPDPNHLWTRTPSATQPPTCTPTPTATPTGLHALLPWARR